jgi:hypothetical protein
VSKKWSPGDTIRIQFAPIVEEVPAVNGEVALQYGALLFARPIPSTKTVVKTYPLPGLEDAYYEPVEPIEEWVLAGEERWNGFGFQPVATSSSTDSLRPFDAPVVTLRGKMMRKAGGERVDVDLVPLGNAPVLRRLTHPVST